MRLERIEAGVTILKYAMVSGAVKKPAPKVAQQLARMILRNFSARRWRLVRSVRGMNGSTRTKRSLNL